MARPPKTGGCVKFDLKARGPENFAPAAQRFSERPDPPLVIAS
jgi:hypothetical protein